jgi:hypothetical protein
MRKTVWSVFLLGALGLCSCTPSPDDLVFLFGPLVDGQGVPLSRATVALERSTPITCAALRHPDTRFVDTSSSEPVPETTLLNPIPFEPVAESTTSETGEFLFELLVAQTQTTSARDRSPACMRLSSTDSNAVITFIHPQTDINLPGLLQWKGELQAGPKLPQAEFPGWTTVELPELPQIPGSDAQRASEGEAAGTLSLKDSEGDPLWIEPAGPTQARSFDVRPYVLEDFTGVSASLSLGGDVTVEGDNPFQPRFLSYHARVSTSPLGLPPPAVPRVPISRGASCKVQTPCPFTDGKLAASLVAAMTPTGPVYSVSTGIELDQARPVAFVVVRDIVLGQFSAKRGDVATFRFEGSQDGTNWSVLGTHESLQVARTRSSHFLTLDLSKAPVSLKYLRFSSSPFPLISLSEISAFEGGE